MLLGKITQTLAAFVVLVLIGTLIGYRSGRADNDNNGSQDEMLMIQTGLSVAASTGIQLNMSNKDPNMVGLGSYLVNVTSDCNLCHSPAFITSSFSPGGNPYNLPGPTPPYFSGKKQVDATVYLGGNQFLGTLGPGPNGQIISRNLTPDKTGQPEGHSLSDFILIMKTGVDLDHVHPSCSASITNNCLAPPINGALLQVMPWSAFQDMTDRQLTAIYTYLSAIPCLEGGPGEPSPRCH